MAGVNAETGAVLDGFDHVQQSINTVITTPVGSRVMREWFGNPGLRLLGENMTQADILRWFATVWAILDLFEPRFRIKQIQVNDLGRDGVADFTIDGEYRPYAHLDWVQASAVISYRDGQVVVSAA